MTFRLLATALLATALLAALLGPGSALGAPATVQLRVEGGVSTAFEGPVATDGKAIDKGDGPHPCDGTNLGANPVPGPTATTALDDGAIAGPFTWEGTWNSGFQDFLINKIGPDASDLGAGRFWNFAINFVPGQVGGCQQPVRPGDEVLFAYDSSCNCPPDFVKQLLRLTGPGRASVGQTVDVTVTDGETGTAVEGASVGGRATGADGHATLSFDSPGVRTLKAEKRDSVRSNALVVCVEGSGVSCDIETPAAGGPAGARGGARDSRAPRARISAPRDGARYRSGPRVLRGSASDPESGVSVVKLALRRYLRGRSCQWWSGRRERFVGTHCRKVFFFAIGSDPQWSYLLPRALSPGRYVLDVKAFDRQRNRDERFRRGSNRVVFEVLPRRAQGRARSRRARTGPSLRLGGKRRGSAPGVQVMVAGSESVLADARIVGARAARVRASGRRCLVPTASPLAALAARLALSGPAYHVRDYGGCSSRSASSSGQLFVDRIGQDRNRGGDGWFYKVNNRAPTIGAADSSGRRLRSADQVLWFYCRFDARAASCQRSLELIVPARRARAGTTLSIAVRGYDNERRKAAVADAKVTLGEVSALTDNRGRAQLGLPSPGRYLLRAERAGTVPAFPIPIRVFGGPR